VPDFRIKQNKIAPHEFSKEKNGNISKFGTRDRENAALFCFHRCPPGKDNDRGFMPDPVAKKTEKSNYSSRRYIHFACSSAPMLRTSVTETAIQYLALLSCVALSGDSDFI